MTQQESIRTVKLPQLIDLQDTEIGPLTAGDWLTQITPLMKDLSPSSSTWWEMVVRIAADNYQLRLQSDHLARLRITPATPPQFQRSPWSRLSREVNLSCWKLFQTALETS